MMGSWGRQSKGFGKLAVPQNQSTCYCNYQNESLKTMSSFFKIIFIGTSVISLSLDVSEMSNFLNFLHHPS